RIDAAATPEQKARLQKLSAGAVKEETLAGEPITAKLTRAPGNDAPIDGLKIVTPGGWFAARPSGTENIYKIYAESFRNAAHLVADVAIGPDRLWRFAVPVPVVVRRQPAPDQPGLADRGRAGEGERLRRRAFFGDGRGFRRGEAVQVRLARGGVEELRYGRAL